MLRGVRRTREGLPGLCFTFGTLQEWFLSIALMIGCLLNGNVFFLIKWDWADIWRKSLYFPVIVISKVAGPQVRSSLWRQSPPSYLDLFNIFYIFYNLYILIYSIIPTSILCGGAGDLKARPADCLQGLQAAGGEGGEQQEGDHGDQQEPHFPDLSTTWSVDQDWMQPWRRSSSFKDPLHHLSSHASSSLTAADPLMSQLSAISAFFAWLGSQCISDAMATLAA